MKKRKRYTAKQKAQIILELLKEEKSVAQISLEYCIHLNLVPFFVKFLDPPQSSGLESPDSHSFMSQNSNPTTSDGLMLMLIPGTLFLPKLRKINPSASIKYCQSIIALAS